MKTFLKIIKIQMIWVFDPINFKKHLKELLVLLFPDWDIEYEEIVVLIRHSFFVETTFRNAYKKFEVNLSVRPGEDIEIDVTDVNQEDKDIDFVDEVCVTPFTLRKKLNVILKR